MARGRDEINRQRRLRRERAPATVLLSGFLLGFAVAALAATASADSGRGAMAYVLGRVSPEWPSQGRAASTLLATSGACISLLGLAAGLCHTVRGFKRSSRLCLALAAASVQGAGAVCLAVGVAGWAAAEMLGAAPARAAPPLLSALFGSGGACLVYGRWAAGLAGRRRRPICPDHPPGADSVSSTLPQPEQRPVPAVDAGTGGNV